MTTPISGSTSNYATQNTTATNTAANTKSSAANPLSALDPQAFLKLLVAQLKYQDPNNPADPTTFMSQTATLTQVQKLTDLSDSQTSMLTSTLSAQASGLVGKTVTYKATATGTEVLSGTVTGATFGPSPTVRIGNTDVPLSLVTGQKPV
ncbi:flagellar hook assembly protein FlgD [Actinokineospora enzanensis]|uniref:flagellar hook assembly protein FlgD n=1 Tax=Actinokineospora enzanensis TaxID=155975 RepID=UPI00036AD7C2|nr:flagellar hook capping FlgD N-terminal domain-containing protein [Actinokineospora enzanensis]